MKIQTKITDYFPYNRKTPKRKLIFDYFRPKSIKNFQNYPMASCKYEPWIQKHVYVPPAYSERCKGIRHPKFCCQCQLRPCLTIGLHDEIHNFLDKNCREQALTSGLNSVDYFVRNNFLKQFFPLRNIHYRIGCLRRYSYRILLEWRAELEKHHAASMRNLLMELESGERTLHSSENGILVTIAGEEQRDRLEIAGLQQETRQTYGMPNTEGEEITHKVEGKKRRMIMENLT